MSMITEQIKRLRGLAYVLELSTNGYKTLIKELREAANAIEQLAAKVRQDNVYKKALADIRAEIDKRTINQGFPKDEWCMSYNDIMKIIDKHDTSKAGKEIE